MKKIYVGNLSRDTSEAACKEIFTEFGEMTSVSLIMDRATGESKGFAFIEFENQASAQEALKKDGEMVDGRRIRVNMAKEGGSTGGARSGGGGGGRSFGGGGGNGSGGGRRQSGW